MGGALPVRLNSVRRHREEALARQAATGAIEPELRTTVAGLLLHSQLALSAGDMPTPVADKLRIVADLANNLRKQLSSSTQPGRPAAR